MPRPREDSPPRPARGSKILRGIAFSIAVVLGAVAVWLIVTGTTQKRIEIGVLAGLWGLLLASYSVFGTRHPHRVVVHHEPAPGQELDLRALGPVETREAAAARRAQEYRLEELLRRQIQAAMAAEVAALRAEVASLRSDLVEKVGGQLRLERIETTRLIGSNLEALQNQVRQAAATREPAALDAYSGTTVTSARSAGASAGDVEDAVEVAVELLSGPLPHVVDAPAPVAPVTVARPAPPAPATIEPQPAPAVPPRPSPWGSRSPFEPAPVSWASDRMPYVPPAPPPGPPAPAVPAAPAAPMASAPRQHSALSGPLPYVPPPREHTAQSGPMPFVPPVPAPPSAPSTPPVPAPAASMPRPAVPTPPPPAPTPPAPVPPAPPRSSDPFADMPRLTRFIDAEPEPTRATPPAAPAPASTPTAPDYAGRRRHDVDAAPVLAANGTTNGTVNGTVNGTNGNGAYAAASRNGAGANSATHAPAGGRRRRDDDDDNDVLARILAREGTSGH